MHSPPPPHHHAPPPPGFFGERASFQRCGACDNCDNSAAFGDDLERDFSPEAMLIFTTIQARTIARARTRARAHETSVGLKKCLPCPPSNTRAPTYTNIHS